MSLHLSATTGEAVTAAQLLGEEQTDVATREAEAERDLKKLQKKMHKAGLLKSTEGKR
ncbi:MAG TPA: hypothetical protein VLI45_09215 [Acidobacteriaceae bacterium]|nr:hypothetical protein [Acidobacteriaceae bacterium]